MKEKNTKSGNRDNNTCALFAKGEKLYEEQKWGEALNCFISILEAEPDNNEAKAYTDVINSILNFYNKDLYNP